MVNHFATLLANLKLDKPQNASPADFLLADDLGVILTDDEDNAIAVSALYEAIQNSIERYKLVNMEFGAIALPTQLQRFHELLFPANLTNEHKQFLLYSYLRVIAATDRANDVLKTDRRITYNLNEIQDYFKLSRVSRPKFSSKEFSLLVSGSLDTRNDAIHHMDSFAVRQLANTANILIYSIVSGNFYNPLKPAAKQSLGMEISLAGINSNTTPTIKIGDTGLAVVLTGPFSSGAFTNTGDKLWVFNAQKPYNFSITDKVKELDGYENIVTSMLAYGNIQDPTYENIWSQHFNSVYRLAGLLLAYVERVQTLCRI